MYSILIVEDEYASRLGLQTIVKNSALQFKDILTANNGEEALTIINLNSRFFYSLHTFRQNSFPENIFIDTAASQNIFLFSS